MNSISLEKTYKIYAPGPVQTPQRILMAGAMAVYHHRTDEFGEIVTSALEKLGPVFGTGQPVLTVNTTGRGAMEAGFTNCLNKDRDKVLVICNGRFGEMAKEILQTNGIPCVPCFEGWEDIVNPEKLKALAMEHKATAVAVVHSDTSNGILNPIRETGAVCRELNMLLFVDCISSFACVPFRFDEWGVDVAVAGIQKGLMCPAGMSVLAVSERAIKRLEEIQRTNYYVNLKSTLEFYRKRAAGLTTPVSLTLSMNEAVNMLYEEGVENVFRRHAVLSAATKAAVKAMGLTLFPEGDAYVRTDSLTVLNLSSEMDRSRIIRHMKEKYGILLSSGMGIYKQSLRIAHMGHVFLDDMLDCINAFECTLYDLGYRDTLGVGVKAFLDKYNELTEQ